MKDLRNFLLTVVFLLTATFSFSQARLQIIHNSADTAVEVVDIWLDETLLLDDFAFRTASAFIDAPAGVEITIGIKGPDSETPNNPMWSQTYILIDGIAYIMVIDGIISVSGYNPLMPFDIELFTGAQEVANQTDKTDILSHHGSTDAPTLDIYEISVGLGLLVDDLSYAEFDGYLEVASKEYIFEVVDAGGTTPIAAYQAALQDLGFKGEAITMIASGFLDPGNNSNGPAFGLWVAPAEGGALVELPEYDPKARMQMINNSADDAAAVVDVWLNETLLLDDFAFRTASPFIDVIAEQEFTIAIKDSDSVDPDDPMWSQNYTLTNDETYVFVAEGIISASGYDPATPFDIAIYQPGREQANMPDKTDMLVHHGSTDTPTLDIYETGVGVGELIDDLGYAEFAAYLELEPLDYILEVRDETGMETIAAFEARFESMGLEGFAVTVVASGFLYPENNSDGPVFGLWMANAAGGNLIELPVYDPQARVQIMHNSADAEAAVVDIWLNETLLLDNFAFQTASPFLDIPAGQEITISVLGPDSNDPENPLWSQTYDLDVDESYILVAEGIISSSGYDPVIPFDIAVFPEAREIANQGSQTDLLIHHGSTDAPAIDIIEVGIGVGQIVDNLAYGEFDGYLGFATVDYIFQVRDETGIIKIAAYEVPLENMGLQGEAVTIIASGFLYPENNSNGPEFALYMALASGGPMIRLPLYAPTARLQLIHNSADTSLGIVDVWLNQTLILDNFTFRSASAFIDAPADEQFAISLKGPESENPYNPLWFHNYTLTEGETYILVADGILGNSGYDPVIPFDMIRYNFGREEAAIVGRTDILFHHGSTDAPTVDIYEVLLGAGLLVDNLSYSEFDGYLELPTINYIFEVREQDDNLLGTFRASLETLGLQNEAITIVASGFLDPSSNSDGAEFGLWAALTAGGPLLELEAYMPKARVQLIHNSADAGVSEVDVWLDETLLLDNFAFRTASPFIDAPANNQFALVIKGSDSVDPSNPLWSQNYTLTEDEKYIMVVSGILSPEGYDPLEPFTLIVYEGAVEQASIGTNSDILFFHGATDAPTVDITEMGADSWVDDLSYGIFDGYLEQSVANYTLDVTDESGENLIGRYSAPFTDMNLGGKSLTLLASGFLDPTINSDGPAFGLLAVQANGTAQMLIPSSGVADSPVIESTFNIYPNPANGHINVSYELKTRERVALELVDITGKVIKSVDLGTINAGIYNEKIDVDGMPFGTYLLNIRTGNGVVGKKVVVR